MRNPPNENGENEPITTICSLSGVEHLNSVYTNKFAPSSCTAFLRLNEHRRLVSRKAPAHWLWAVEFGAHTQAVAVGVENAVWSHFASSRAIGYLG